MNNVDVGIDLGATSTKIFINGIGLIANVKSVIAVNRETGQLIDIGSRAYEMIGRAPKHVELVAPFINGSVSDLTYTKMFIDEILNRVINVPIKRVRLFVCVHSGVTELEEFTIVNAVFSNRIDEIFLVSEPVASGLGAGFDLNRGEGLIIVNIGGGTTDMVYVDACQEVKSHFLRFGGRAIDRAIEASVLKEYGLYVGKLSAEKLKIQAMNLSNCNLKKFKLSGKDRVSKLPKSVFLNSQDVSNLTIATVDRIVNEIVNFVYSWPHRLYGEGLKLILTGGTSLISGFADYVAKKVPVQVYVVNDPIGCAVLGLSELFKWVDLKNSCFVRSA